MVVLDTECRHIWTASFLVCVLHVYIYRMNASRHVADNFRLFLMRHAYLFKMLKAFSAYLWPVLQVENAF